MDKGAGGGHPGPVEERSPRSIRMSTSSPGYGFRVLVGDIHHLIVLYHSLARRLSEAETEKDFPPAEEKGRRL